MSNVKCKVLNGKKLLTSGLKSGVGDVICFTALKDGANSFINFLFLLLVAYFQIVHNS